VLPAEYQALLIGAEVVPLPHPIKDLTLKKHGESCLSASLKGRLLRVEKRLCLGCGEVFDSPRIEFDRAAGCLPGIVAGLGAGLWLKFLGNWSLRPSVGVAFLVCVTVTLAGQGLGSLYVRALFGERQQSIQQGHCPSCGQARSERLDKLEGRKTMLGSGERWVSVQVAGRS
jgi:hypothetical protein